MVNRANDRRSVPRDEVVTRGLEARGRHGEPWVYEARVKSGTRRAEKVTLTAYNIKDLWGQIIANKARRNEDIFAWNISRMLRSQMASKTDY